MTNKSSSSSDRDPQAQIQALEQAAEDARMGHVRIDECSGSEATKGRPLYDRISAIIQRLVDKNTEPRHNLLATGKEKDAAIASLGAAEHRRAAAEYRAQHIVLDEELRLKNLALSQQLTAKEQEIAALQAQLTTRQQETDEALGVLADLVSNARPAFPRTPYRMALKHAAVLAQKVSDARAEANLLSDGRQAQDEREQPCEGCRNSMTGRCRNCAQRERHQRRRDRQNRSLIRRQETRGAENG